MKSLLYIWKNKWKIFIVSCVVTAVFFSSLCYKTHYSAGMTMSFIYPNSEKGKYPDGTRFNAYDMVSDDVLKATIDAYNEVSPLRISLSDIENSIYIKECLTTDVESKVNEARQLGMDYSYFANEYNVTFQPVFKLGVADKSKWFGLKPYVDNNLFMEKFYESYVNYFMQQHAEKNIIKGLSKDLDTNTFDYLEISSRYTNQVNMCINYLEGKNQENGSFRSTQTGLTFNDLINSFRNFKNVQIQNLTAFVSSSKLTKDPVEFVNKLQVENVRNNLEYSKYKAEADLSKQAMNEYDHTFEENIVVAGVSEEDGLYQTRAKTAYDTITKRAHDAGVKAENIYQDIEENKRLIQEYGTTKMTDDERTRLSQIADGMIGEIKTANADLVEKADTTVEEYLKSKSSDYVRREVSGKSYINLYVIIKCGIVFVGTGVLVLCFLVMKDFGKKNKIKLFKKKNKANKKNKETPKIEFEKPSKYRRAKRARK